MKTKKVLAALFAALLIGSALAGCSENGANSSSTPSSGPAVSSSAPASSANQEDASSADSQTSTGEPTPSEILTAIEKVYGEDFLANMDMPDEMFESQFPVDKDLSLIHILWAPWASCWKVWALMR